MTPIWYVEIRWRHDSAQIPWSTHSTWDNPGEADDAAQNIANRNDGSTSRVVIERGPGSRTLVGAWGNMLGIKVNVEDV